MHRYLLLLLAVFIVCTSCKIEQHFTFNDDFSGEMIQSLDYSSAKELMEMDTLNGEAEHTTLLTDSLVDETQKEIESIKGARLVSLTDQDYKLQMVVAFDHLKALNKVLVANADGSDDTNLYCQFKQSGKSMRVEFVVEKPAQVPAEPGDEEFEMNTDEFNELITYQFGFTFESDVKSTSGTAAITLEDGKTVVVEQNLQQFLSPEFDRVLQIEFE